MKTGANGAKNGKNGSPRSPRRPPPGVGHGSIRGSVLAPPGVGMPLDGDMFGPPFAPMPTEKLSAWIDGLYAKGPVSRIRLTQKVAGGESPVGEWDAEELREHEGPESIAEMIYSAATSDAEGQGSLVRYVCLAYRGSDVAPVSRCWFRLSAEDLDQIADSEDPTAPSGHLSMAYRHSEASTKLLLAGVADCMRTMSRELARVTSQNERFEERHVEFLMAMESLLDKKAIRDIQIKKAEADLTRGEKHRDLKEGVAAWGLSELARVGGVNVPPQLVSAFMPPAVQAIAAAAKGGAMGNGAGSPGIKPPLAVDLTEDERKLVTRATTICLGLLAHVGEPEFEMVVGRVRADARDGVRACRADLRARRQQGAVQQPPSDEEKVHALIAQTVILELLVGLSDFEFMAVASWLADEGQRSEVLGCRTMLRAKHSTTSTTTTTNGGPVSGAVSTTPANGHGPEGTNGAPTSGGAS